MSWLASKIEKRRKRTPRESAWSPFVLLIPWRRHAAVETTASPSMRRRRRCVAVCLRVKAILSGREQKKKKP